MKKQQRYKIIKVIAALCVIALLGLIVEFFLHRYISNRSAVFRTENNKVQIYRNKRWRDFAVKGASVNPGKADNQGGEPDSKDEYRRWFREQAAAGVNVIRIGAILPPAFYQAFFEYNVLAAKPLYLLQGIRVGEENIKTYLNAYEDELNNDFLDEIRRTIDVVHGKAALKQPKGQALDTYNLNIAPYLIGYILGEEINEDFVITTNEKNPQFTGFEGDYLYVQNATPYQAWLAAVGNFAVSYEQEKYGGPGKLLSWTDWFTADVVGQSQKPGGESGAMDVKYARIQITEKFEAGILAAQHLLEKFTEHTGF